MKNLVKCSIGIAVLASIQANGAEAAARFRFAAADNTKCPIVIAEPASPADSYAAQELQHYLERITSVRLPILPDSSSENGPAILVGDSRHVRDLGITLDREKLGPEGFILRTSKDRLVLAGGAPRGTLYAIYTFLEEKLGVRWFTPELEAVPQTNRLSFANLDVTHRPALEYREVFWTEMMRNADFAARHRLNGEHYGLSDKHGGRAVVYFPFVHSFDNLIPRELFKEHPEYFPLIDGKRVDGYVQRCLSNPEAIGLAVAKVRQWIKEHPEATIISVSQNDTGNWCRCETCKAFDDEEGSPSASLIRFVNKIAQDIESDYPKIKIDTLAYQYTRKPPKTLRPRQNVIVRLCSIECCFAHPLATCVSKENRQFREDILAWQPVAPKLYVWDYTPNFGHYQQPFPNFEALQPNVRFFVEHGVSGLFEQGNYSPGGFGELGPLRAYLLAKLLWDPETNLERHKSEFLNAYYRKAAPALHAYLTLLESQVSLPQTHAHIFDSSKASYLNNGFLAEANRILGTAENNADDETIRLRVAIDRLPIQYVQLATGRVQGEERSALIKSFLQVARRAGISNISEGQSLDAWAKKMETE